MLDVIVSSLEVGCCEKKTACIVVQQTKLPLGVCAFCNGVAGLGPGSFTSEPACYSCSWLAGEYLGSCHSRGRPRWLSRLPHLNLAQPGKHLRNKPADRRCVRVHVCVRVSMSVSSSLPLCPSLVVI